MEKGKREKINRLEAAFEAAKMKRVVLNKEEFAKKIGYSRSHYYKFLSGEYDIDDEMIHKAEELVLNKTPDVSHDTLVKEGGASYGLPAGVNLVETQSDANEFLKQRRALKNNGEPYMVPLVPVAAQAGYAKAYFDPVYISSLERYPILPGIDPHGTQWRYFQVKGNSMEETFKENQIVLANQIIKEDWQNIENFYVYVIVTDDQVMIKRLAKVKGKNYWAAISDNEQEHPQFRLMVSDVKELWKYRRHIEWDAGAAKKFQITV